VPDGATTLPPQGRAFAVDVGIEGRDGPLGREAVIRMTDDPATPFWILSWRPR